MRLVIHTTSVFPACWGASCQGCMHIRRLSKYGWWLHGNYQLLHGAKQYISLFAFLNNKIGYGAYATVGRSCTCLRAHESGWRRSPWQSCLAALAKQQGTRNSFASMEFAPDPMGGRGSQSWSWWPERSRCSEAGRYYGLCRPHAQWLGAVMLTDQLIMKMQDKRALLTKLN